MKNYSEVIQDFNHNNPILAFYQHGLKPDDIKAGIIETFKPYFSNHANLRKYVTIFVSDWINFMQFSQDKKNLQLFEKCLKLFNEAKISDMKSSIAAVAEWVPDINQSVIKFWSFKNLEKNKDCLELEEFLEENLKTIGQIVEGISKPYIKLLLQINRIRRNKIATFETIKYFDLGDVIDELMSTTDFQELFAPEPWKIRLNQWRNIAYHHNAKIENGGIICWYGRKDNIKEFIITREELFKVTKSLLNSFNALKNVAFVFAFDNLTNIQKECEKRNYKYQIRGEAELLEFYYGIVSQGFKIIEITKTDEKAKLIIEDLRDENIKERCIHSSMFLYHLWAYSGSKKLVVEYRKMGGEPFFESETNEGICKKVFHGKEEISYLAQNASFKFLKDNISIPAPNEDEF